MCPKVWHIILLYLSNYVVNNGTPKTGFSEHGCPTLFVHKIESIKRVKYEKGGWSSFIKSSISLNRGSLNRGSLNQGSLNQGSLNQGSLNRGILKYAQYFLCTFLQFVSMHMPISFKPCFEIFSNTY